MTTEEMRITTGLKPRAIAALCALRSGPREVVSLRNAIGDPTTTCTRDLLSDMRTMGLVGMASGSSWYLGDQGVAWLETNGMKAR